MFAAGYNMPGYLPDEGCFWEFDTLEEATDWMVDELNIFCDLYLEAAYVDSPDYLSQARIDAAFDDAKRNVEWMETDGMTSWSWDYGNYIFYIYEHFEEYAD